MDDESVPYIVNLALAVEGGSPVIEGVQLERRPGTPPLSSRVVRQVRVGEYAQAAATLAAFRAEHQPDGSVSFEPAQSSGTFDVVPDDSRGRRMTPSHLQAVAAVYNAAVAAGSRAPRKAVADDARWRPVPPNTAARWVRAARDAGLIPEGAVVGQKSSNKSTVRGRKGNSR